MERGHKSGQNRAESRTFQVKKGTQFQSKIRAGEYSTPFPPLVAHLSFLKLLCLLISGLIKGLSPDLAISSRGGDNMVIFKNHSCNPLDHCSYTTEV